MASSLDKLTPFSIEKPDILYGLHDFNGTTQVGPAHYRLPQYSGYTSNTGHAQAIFLYNDQLIRVMDGQFLTTTGYLDASHYNLTGTSFSYALQNDLLIISDDDTIMAYDHNNPLWGFVPLGQNVPPTSDFPSISYTSGDIDPGSYYYRLVYVDQYLQRGKPSPAVGPIVVSSDGATISFAEIPQDSSNKRLYTEIYRTYADQNDSGYNSFYYLVGNTTSATFVDTKADASLTETLRYGTTFGSEYGAIPSGHNLTTWGQRLAWTRGNRLFISAITDAGNPMPSVTLQSYYIGADDDIIALATKDKSLIILKASGIWLMEPYSYNIHLISETHGIATPSQVCSYLGTVAFLSGGHVYILDGLKDISEVVAPLFSEFEAHGPERLWTDHQGHLFVTASVARNTNPTWDTPKYVTYNFQRGAWTRCINLDWVVSLPDHLNNRTLGITPLGRLEILDWTRSKEGVYTPTITASYTCTSAGRVTLPSVSAFTSGDYVWYYNADTLLWYSTAVNSIVGNTIYLHDNYLRTGSHQGDYIGIGTQYYSVSGPLYTDKADDVDISGYRAICEGDTTQPLISFYYDSEAHPQPLTDCYNNDHLVKISAKRRGWYLRPAITGIAHGVMKILHSIIDIVKAGKA